MVAVTSSTTKPPTANLGLLFLLIGQAGGGHVGAADGLDLLHGAEFGLGQQLRRQGEMQERSVFLPFLTLHMATVIYKRYRSLSMFDGSFIISFIILLFWLISC